MYTTCDLGTVKIVTAKCVPMYRHIMHSKSLRETYKRIIHQIKLSLCPVCVGLAGVLPRNTLISVA